MGTQTLARTTTARTPVVPAAQAAMPRRLSPREKAAVIVRLLMAEGAPLPLSGLPEQMQSALAEQMGRMRTIDRATVAAVIQEFLEELEQIGLTFPGGIDGALGLMDGHLSPQAMERLRQIACASPTADPWIRIIALPAERLLPLLDAESVEIAAVVLSKLPVPAAADLLSRMPGDRARRVAHSVSLTAGVAPDAVRRIGQSIVAQMDATPRPAFDAGPVERVGAILNVSPAATRDAVLSGLEDEDAGFAAEVRRKIFTFAHMPSRLQTRDVPRVVRLVDPQVLVIALSGAAGAPDTAIAAEFLLANMPRRMAEGLRDELSSVDKVSAKDSEDAMTAVIVAVRQLEAAGELTLIQEQS